VSPHTRKALHEPRSDDGKGLLSEVYTTCKKEGVVYDATVVPASVLADGHEAGNETTRIPRFRLGEIPMHGAIVSIDGSKCR
jgi:hypothetical protein